jgi:hypothetical protein
MSSASFFGSVTTSSRGAGLTASKAATMVWWIPTSPIALTSQITIRLSSDNYIYWRTQVVPILRSNLIYGFINGTLPCPSEMVPAADKTVEPVSNPLYSA